MFIHIVYYDFIQRLCIRYTMFDCLVRAVRVMCKVPWLKCELDYVIEAPHTRHNF